MYITIAIVRNIIHAASAHGADLKTLCKTVGLKPEDLLQDSEKRIDGVEKISALWEVVLEQTKDQFFGLHLSPTMTPSSLGLMGHLLQNCPTLGDALDVFVNFYSSITGWVTVSHSIVKDEVEVVYKMSTLWSNYSPNTARQAIDMTFGVAPRLMNDLSGLNIAPLRFESQFSKPPSIFEYERMLNSPIHFSCETNKIIYKKEFLSIPVLNFDKSLYALFMRILAERELLSSENVSFVDKIKHVVINDFKGQVPSIDVIASYFNISSRSFQRRLGNEKTTYRVVSNEIKKDLSIAMLKSPFHSTRDIARMLGYTEPAAFHAAFKGWVKETPARWRERHNIKAFME